MTDNDNFEAFMRAYQNMVFTTAVRLLGNCPEAEDIAQEVFVRAYQHFHELEASPTAGGWLKTVATNLCLNHLTRYRARWKLFSDMHPNEEEERFGENIPAEEPAEALTDIDRRQLLEKAMTALPAGQRVPLVLFHFHGLSYEEIAAQLKISLSKVKTDIHRGREALRSKLQRVFGEERGHTDPASICTNPGIAAGPKAAPEHARNTGHA